MTPAQQAGIEAAQHALFCAQQDNAGQDALDRCWAELRAARIDAESLDERAFRLGLEAADKDAEAERHLVAAADAAGRAAGRRLRFGEDEMVRSFDREEMACTKLATECMAEAERLRSQVRSIRRSKALADHILGLMTAGKAAA